MKKFDKFVNENVDYPKDYLIKNNPKYIEHLDLWDKAVDIATKNGKEKTNYVVVVSIYNNLEKNKDEQRKDYIKTSPTYWRQLFNGSNGLSRSQIKFYDKIITQLEKDGVVSPKQFKELKRLQSGDFEYHSKN